MSGCVIGNAASFAARQAYLPASFTATCRQCHGHFHLLLFQSTDELEVAVFPQTRGGIATSQTPPAVAFYLDQASRSKASGAHSAAVVMFRAALEHVLHTQGYEEGTCGVRLKRLEADVKAAKGPAWCQHLGPEDLRILKELGDGAIHVNDGDVARQLALDRGLVSKIEIVFSELLQVVYERPAQQEARLKELQGVAATLKAP